MNQKQTLLEFIEVLYLQQLFLSSSTFFFLTHLFLLTFPLDLAIISEASRTTIIASWLYHCKGH